MYMQLLGATECVNLPFDAKRQGYIASRQRPACILEKENDGHVPIIVCRNPFLRTFQALRSAFLISRQQVRVTEVCVRSHKLRLVDISLSQLNAAAS